MTDRHTRLDFGGMLLLVAAFSTALALGQTESPKATPEFEVASIKPRAGIADKAYVQALPGRLLMQNFSPRTLMLLAYGVEDYQILGGPSWIVSDHYDLQAKAGGNATVQQMEGPMLQALLEDQFKLTFHRETREQPIYELVAEIGNGKLKYSKGNCTPYSVDLPPPPVPAARESNPVLCGFPRLVSNGLSHIFDGAGISIERLATSLSRSLHEPVVNKTRLAGTFDIHLEWTDEAPNGGGNPELSDHPSIFTALREQLGLRLESARGPVEVIVIDHVERPSPN
jgi:uncharacterized protein (TIGR03435 family)